MVGQIVVTVAGDTPGGKLGYVRPPDADPLVDIISEIARSVDPERVEGGTDEVLEGTVMITVPPRSRGVGPGPLSARSARRRGWVSGSTYRWQQTAIAQIPLTVLQRFLEVLPDPVVFATKRARALVARPVAHDLLPGEGEAHRAVLVAFAARHRVQHPPDPFDDSACDVKADPRSVCVAGMIEVDILPIDVPLVSVLLVNIRVGESTVVFFESPVVENSLFLNDDRRPRYKPLRLPARSLAGIHRQDRQGREREGNSPGFARFPPAFSALGRVGLTSNAGV